MSETDLSKSQVDIDIAESYKTHIAQHLPESISLESFLAICARPLRRAIRVNTLKISVEDFLVRSQNYPWQLKSIPWCTEGFWLEDSEYEKLGNHPDHVLGLFYIQEASSMLPPVALFLDADPLHATTLDMAAAPGSKTTQIAAITQNTGILVANELSSSRLKSLYANLIRCGVSHSVLTHLDGKHFGEFTPESFDFILLDAPCGGEGTVRKDPNALTHWSLDQVKAMAHVQQSLLRSAILSLRPGGTLVYSTCTLSPEENEMVVDALIEEFPSELEAIPLNKAFPGANQATTKAGYLKIWPNTFDSEGFFVAKLKKKSSTIKAEKKAKLTKTNKLGKFPFEPIDTKNYQLLRKEAQQAFLLSLDSHQARLWQKDDTLWFFPESIDPFIGSIKMDRIGLKLATVHRNGVQFSPEFLVGFNQQIEGGRYACSLQEANDFLCGKDLRPTQVFDRSFVVVEYQGFPLGMAKNLGKKLKNKLPREQVARNPVFDAKDTPGDKS